MNELFLKIINMSISASWLVLAVLILRLVLKKAPKWVNVLLWGIVAIRLICPFSFESAFSLIPSAETIPEKVISGPSFDVQTGITPVDNRINEYLGDRYFEGVTVPADNGFNVMTTLAIVWGVGILLLIAYTAISYWRLRCKVDTAVRYKDNIFQSENVRSPFVLGIIKPRIYLPFKMDSQDLEHVVAHEQAHIRRKDHLWKPLGFLLLTIHWFNPLMWLAYILLCRDIEFACDEKVIKELGSEQRADYTEALVACSINRHMIAACPLAFGEVGVKERVKSVMNYRKPAFWIVVVAVIASVVVAVCFLTDPETKQDLTFLNYENLVSVAAQSDTHPASKSDDQSRYIIDGPKLAKFLDTTNWTAQTGITRNIQRDTDQNSKSSIQITLDGTYLKVFDTDTANIYDPTTGKDRYYRMANGDYEKLLAMLTLDNKDTFDNAVTGNTYLYEGEGFMGNFTITLYNDGTFTYYEGMASSYIGVGSWEQDGDTITLTDDGYSGYGLVNHFRCDGNDLVFVEQNSDNFVYVKVKDGETFRCTGEAFKPSHLTATAAKWFDYLETPDEMKWDGSLDINLPEFPDVTFRWSYGEMVAVKGNEITSLYTGMPIWNTYFCDLSGDGLPELCSTISWGSGMIDNRVIIYDYANGVSYSLEDRGISDYTLRQDESDGLLYVDKTAHMGGGLLSTGRLVFEAECLQVLWPEKPNENIREITDPTDDPNFAYDTAIEKIYEDEHNEYFISGLYSQHIIVHYTDGTQEDIVTALNAGSATIADLDKFGIRYWAEPKTDSLDAAISSAILAHYASDEPDGLIHVESHVLLANEGVSGTPLVGADDHAEKVTAYLLVHHVKYSTYGGALEAVGGSYVPTAITFKITNSGEYVLEEYWEPRDGSYYTKDIRDKFPGATADDALNDQAYIADLKEQTYNKALAYLNNNISLDVRIGGLLNEIQTSPAHSSNPGDYIREHEAEYEELLSYGEYTLKFCFTEFLRGGQIDLRGHIMALACQDIADVLGEKKEPLDNIVMTGQDWFDGFHSYAQVLAKNHNAEDLEKYYPATFLLLQMSNSEFITKN